MKRYISIHLKKHFLLFVMLLGILVFLPQKASGVDCCRQTNCFTTSNWSSPSYTRCPNDPDNYCYMKYRTWYCNLSDCENEPSCPHIQEDCTYSSSTEEVVKQDTDCTDEVTQTYREWEVIRPCDTADTCFYNCDEAENALEELTTGTCP
jgi:hypothetical protein